MKKRKPHHGRGGNPAKQKPATRLPAPVVAHRISMPPAASARAPLTRAPQRSTAVARVSSGSFSRDDRQTLLLLLAPFLIVAASLASQQLLRGAMTRAPEIVIARPAPVVPAPIATAPAVAPPAQTPPFRFELPPGVTPAERTTVALRRAPPPPVVIEQSRAAALPSAAPAAPIEIAPAPAPGFAWVPMPPYELPELSLLRPEPTTVVEPRVAALDRAPPAIERAAPIPVPIPVPPLELPDLAVPQPPLPLPPAAVATKHPSAPVEVCAAPAGLLGPASARSIAAPPADPRQFGLTLAAAARAQIDDAVIYNSRYQRLSYPMGDVSPLYGVCTDVVVRAYRALGIDLQELIVTTRSGTGDRNIDHRRVEVVRRFLEKHGERLAITEFAENYQPGDIVTYYRPQNRSSTSHIAVVSDVMAPSGRYLIAHNRGWGTQLEDALFVDKITGHYRFRGLSRPATAVAGAESTSPAPAAASPAITKVAATARNRAPEPAKVARR